jgi:hypothetical protein
MKNLKDFIDENLNEFSNLNDSEVCEIDINEFDNEVLDYLIKNYRFDYKGICVYYVKDENEIWIENMNN